MLNGEDYFFMTASRKDFPGENFTTLRVGILIPNPVNGLRPGRALCSRTQKAPTPDHESISPRAIQSSKIFSKALISFEASTTHNPLAAATAFISSCLFMALFFISCFFVQAKIAFSDRKGTGKALSRLSPRNVSRVCLFTYDTFTRFNPFRPVCPAVARPEGWLHSCYILRAGVFPLANLHGEA